MTDADVVVVLSPEGALVSSERQTPVSSEVRRTAVVSSTRQGHVVVERESRSMLLYGQVGPVGPAGDGGDDSYVRATPVPVALGGVAAGTTFSGTVADALDALLYPYQSPSFTSFSFPQTTPIEVGASVSAGVKSFTWATSNSGNVEASSISIQDVTGGGSLGAGLANDGEHSVSIGAVTKTSATSHSWQISALNTHSASFSRTFSVSWQWRTFYGESASPSLDEAGIEGLRVSGLSSSFSGNKVFVGGGYKWLAYPTTFGLRTTFKDTATNLDVAMEAAIQVPLVNAYGVSQNYYVHRTTNQLGGAITIAVS